MRTHYTAISTILLCSALGTMPTMTSASDEGPSAGDGVQIEKTADVPYLLDPDGTTHVLRVYAPTSPGPWPTAVMIHGGGGAYGAAVLDPWARAVAAEGAVVFVPYHFGNPTWSTAAAAIAEITDVTGQLACAVRFARSEAGRYGGDPADVALFGHSAGANLASVIALTDPPVSPDCLADADSAIPEELVLFEGDWLLLGLPVYDPLITEDPSVMDVLTPWSHTADAPRIPIAILDSDDPSLSVHTQDRIDDALALRDPDGVYRNRLDRASALEDERLTETDAQHLLAEELSNRGYPVYFIDLPDSNHERLSDTALAMVTDALVSGSAGPSVE